MNQGHTIEGYPFFSKYRLSRDRKEAIREVEEFYYLITSVRWRMKAGEPLSEMLRGRYEWERERIQVIHSVLSSYDLWCMPMQYLNRKSSIVVRRFVVCMLWSEEHDHTIAEKICDMFPMAHDTLSECTEENVRSDRRYCLYIPKYNTDWQRPAA